jgi:hypothetical protein
MRSLLSSLLFSSFFLVIVFVAAILLSSSVSQIDAAGLQILSYTTGDCTGVGKIKSYVDNECKDSYGTSARFFCNATHAAISSFSGAADCTGAFSKKTYTLGDCYPSTTSLSSKYLCGAGAQAVIASVALLILVAVLNLV